MAWLNIVFWFIGTLIVVLGPIVLIHELGHFIFAKLSGVRVEEFGFGFPPRMLTAWHGMGYIEIGKTRVTIPRRLALSKKLKLPPSLLIGSYASILAEPQDDGTYVLREVTVLDEDVEDVSPKHESTESGERIRGEVMDIERGTIYSLNWLPIGAFVKMTGEEDPSDPRSLAAQPKRWRITILGAGIVLNIILAAILMIGAFASGIPEEFVIEVSQVQSNTAAAEAKLQPGDVVLAIDGQSITDGARQVRKIIQAAPGETIQLTIRRGKETLTLEATPRPRACAADEANCTPDTGFLGITMMDVPNLASVHYYTIPEATRASFEMLKMILRAIVTLPRGLIQGDVSPQEVRPTSLVGAGQILTFALQQSVEMGLPFPALQSASLISLALGLTNLLPLPALDGGRILFVIIEAIRGKRISPEREAVIHFIGFVILIFMMVLVVFYDVFSPVIPWSILAR